MKNVERANRVWKRENTFGWTVSMVTASTGELRDLGIPTYFPDGVIRVPNRRQV
jgi:hypothetical protein